MHSEIGVFNVQKDLFTQQHRPETNTNHLVSSFNEILNERLGVSQIISELESQYGVTVTVASFSKTNDGSTIGLSGLKNVVISPEILKQMETNPKLKERIFNNVGKLVDPVWDMETRAFIRIAGLVETNRGIIVHDDGTVSWFGNAEPTEEEKKRIEELKRNKEKSRELELLFAMENDSVEIHYTNNFDVFATNPYLLSIIGSEYVSKKNNK